MVQPTKAMRNDLLSLLSFAIGIAAYTCSQIVQHGKWRWDNTVYGFFGSESSWRKYKPLSDSGFQLTPAPKTWYYKLFKIKYKEKFPLSATLLVWTTDFYHLSQALFFIFISLSVVPILGWTYGIAFWILAHVIHFVLYRTLQR